MPKLPKGKSPLQSFTVGAGDAISVRFRSPKRDALTISVKGKALTQEPLRILPLAGTEAIRKLNLNVKAATAYPVGDTVQMEIRVGKRIFRRKVQTATAQNTIRLRFLTESSGKLVYCPRCDDYVAIDANGNCSYCHVKHAV